MAEFLPTRTGSSAEWEETRHRKQVHRLDRGDLRPPPPAPAPERISGSASCCLSPSRSAGKIPHELVHAPGGDPVPARACPIADRSARAGLRSRVAARCPRPIGVTDPAETLRRGAVLRVTPSRFSAVARAPLRLGAHGGRGRAEAMDSGPFPSGDGGGCRSWPARWRCPRRPDSQPRLRSPHGATKAGAIPAAEVSTRAAPTTNSDTNTITTATTPTTTIAKKTNRHRRAKRRRHPGARTRRRHRLTVAAVSAGSSAVAASRNLEAVSGASRAPSTAGSAQSPSTTRGTLPSGSGGQSGEAGGSSSAAATALEWQVQLVALTWALAAGVAVGPLIAYLWSRSIGLPGDAPDIGNWLCTLGMVALLVESFLLALSITRIGAGRRSR